MEKIKSFQIDHTKLLPGAYVSRIDGEGDAAVTTFDLRFTAPNIEPPMDGAGMHTIEHLAATYLRNDPQWSERIVYFGPMGCRTGFYLLMFGKLEPEDIVELLRGCFSFVRDFEGEIPGAKPDECGNYSYHNLDAARYYARRYLEALGCGRFRYPE